MEAALVVSNGTFSWEAPLDIAGPKSVHEEIKSAKLTQPFLMREVNIVVPRNSLCAIVGSVGSGMRLSSFLYRFCLF